MANATGVTERVSTMRLCDVLALFIEHGLTGKKWQSAMDGFWGKLGVCVGCHITIALAAPVFWNGDGFVHAGHIKSGTAMSWEKVCLPGHGKSVAEMLRQRSERLEAQEAA